MDSVPDNLQENQAGIKADWPRIPLPADAASLSASAKLGRELSELLDGEQIVGVNKTPIRKELHAIARIQRTDGKPVDPGKDLVVDRAWGRPQQGAVFPGPGDARLRDYSTEELDFIRKGADALGMDAKALRDLLGERTYDVYINEVTYFCNVPENVWDFHIGGHPVIKKWLSYRETALLGRPMSQDDAKHVRETARRIAAILLFQPTLNQNYETVCAKTISWAALKPE